MNQRRPCPECFVWTRGIWRERSKQRASEFLATMACWRC